MTSINKTIPDSGAQGHPKIVYGSAGYGGTCASMHSKLILIRKRVRNVTC